MPNVLKLAASWKPVAAAFGLTAATRVLLQSLTEVPLSAGATTLVAAFWLGVCVLLSWLSHRRGNAKAPDEQTTSRVVLILLLCAAGSPYVSAQPRGLCIPFQPGSTDILEVPGWLEHSSRVLGAHEELRWEVSGTAGDSEAATAIPALLLAKRRASAVTVALIGWGVPPRSIFASVTRSRSADCGVLITVLDPDGRPVSLELRTAAPDPPARLRATGREYLVNRSKELEGYGLYTYLLFPKKPAAEDVEAQGRLRSAVEGFLRARSISAIEEAIRHFEGDVDRSQLNIWYLPVRSIPESETPEELLRHYDWAVAEYLAGRADGREQLGARGPYLVSATAPLGSRSRRVLCQDLSRVPGGPLMTRWLDVYIEKAQQPQRWAETDLREHALRLQTELENLVPELKAAKEAITTVLLGWREIAGGGR